MEPKVNDQRELISMLLILCILLGVCQHMEISYTINKNRNKCAQYAPCIKSKNARQ